MVLRGFGCASNVAVGSHQYVSELDPVMRHVVSLVGLIRHRPRNTDGHFGALVRSIVFQQLAGHAANAIHQRVQATVSGKLDPASLAAVPDEELRAARLLSMVGEVQREDEVVHVIAHHLEDHSLLLGRLAIRSRDFH